jgi:eukaryotic-like serine/threonine-protein kinase
MTRIEDAARITERLGRRATPDLSDVDSPVVGALPSRELAQGASRLGILALLTGLIVTSMTLLEQLVFRPASYKADPVGILAVAGAAAISLGVFATSRRSDVDAARFLDLGFVYEVLTAFLFAIAIHAAPGLPGVPPHGWSPIAVWVVVFPLIVPSARGKTILAAIAAALMDPLGLALNVVRGHPVPGALVVAQMLLPTAFAAVAAIVGARMIERLSAAARQARELGSYRLLEFLGTGGMGEVWRAEHRMLARPAAVKLIRERADLFSLDTLARFEREARATASLRSPHTIHVYDFGTTEDGRFYYAMELLDGFSLEDLVRRHGPQPEGRVVHLLRQVCHSLEEAHRSGLVHRDVKPGNVFVCRYGLDLDFVKVLDFGLVKPIAGALLSGLSAKGFVAGTPEYMAPEVALGRAEVDGRADIYALGCVGFFLLTGLGVFSGQGRTPMEIMIDHTRTRPPRPSERAGRPFHRGLEDLLMACLAKEPRDRPESARKLDRRLASLGLEGSWTPERAQRWWEEVAAHDQNAGPSVVMRQVLA